MQLNMNDESQLENSFFKRTEVGPLSTSILQHLGENNITNPWRTKKKKKRKKEGGTWLKSNLVSCFFKRQTSKCCPW